VRDAACTREVITSLGARVFRRPLTQADVDRYATLAATEADFEAGVRLSITAMLQSPHFIYRRELGAMAADGSFVLDGYEVASELSYLLWQTMPDQALIESAAKGELTTPAQIEARAMAMLEDERSRPTVRAFVLEWLGLDAITNVPKDPERFPELDAELRAAMLAEIERFIDHVMSTSGSLQALLTTPETFLDQRLADLYGVDTTTLSPNADGVYEVAMADQERVGILTLGGVMMRHGRSNDSSPVHRGRLVRERFLCQIPPPPPPGIVVQPPPDDPTKTSRQRYAAHSENQPCKGCHVLMDPIGFAFERFDGIGRYRQMENGASIDVSGEIFNTDATDGAFSGTEELASVLAASSDVASCITRQWLRFAYGLQESSATTCVTTPLVDALQGEALTMSALVRATASSAHLRVRYSVGDAPVGGDPDPGNPMSASPDAGTDPDPGNPMSASPDASVDPDPDPPTGDQGLTLANDNDYGSGYCHTYEVKNLGSAPLTWSAAIELDGTLMQHWESLVDGMMGVTSATGTVTFSGVTHNMTLSPEATTQFGFCVTR
jgi:hypothetical protein